MLSVSVNKLLSSKGPPKSLTGLALSLFRSKRVVLDGVKVTADRVFTEKAFRRDRERFIAYITAGLIDVKVLPSASASFRAELVEILAGNTAAVDAPVESVKDSKPAVKESAPEVPEAAAVSAEAPAAAAPAPALEPQEPAEEVAVATAAVTEEIPVVTAEAAAEPAQTPPPVVADIPAPAVEPAVRARPVVRPVPPKAK